MGLKSTLIQPFARKIAGDIRQWASQPIAAQEATFRTLIRLAKDTRFGKEHHFDRIRTYEDFKASVPVRDYEGFRAYIEQIKAGETDVLWRGRPVYFAKTSGTTSGVKYIPLSKESLPNHVGTAVKAVLNYAFETKNYSIFDGKAIFLSGSPQLQKSANGIYTGRLSGIVNHQVPFWLKPQQVPSYATNCIEAWEEKVARITEETIHQDMRIISGIPPWVQMYYERLLAQSGKATIRELFPNYGLFVYGGVNFEPYRRQLEQLVGGRMDTLETYPASEGFIAFQDSQQEEGLLLNVNDGLFFEFIPADAFFSANPTRLWLKDVEIGVNYALLINNNAGLWGYNIGDTVRFVSKNPYRLLVTGRIKHFISAFGEHVIGKEVEEAMRLALQATDSVRVAEFTVAPQVNPPKGELPYHEWLVAFEQPPVNVQTFARYLDAQMVKQNIYYEDLIAGNILQPLKITPLRPDAFRAYMKAQGKLGGQNKVPRLANDRSVADALAPFVA